LDENGQQVKRAGPSKPVQILGWSATPNAGDDIREVADEREARHMVQEREAKLAEAAAALRTSPDDVAQKIGQIQESVKGLERELTRLKSKMASSQGDELTDRAEDVNGVKVLAAALDGADAKTLRDTLDKLKDRLHSAAIVLAAADGEESAA